MTSVCFEFSVAFSSSFCLFNSVIDLTIHFLVPITVLNLPPFRYFSFARLSSSLCRSLFQVRTSFEMYNRRMVNKNVILDQTYNFHLHMMLEIQGKQSRLEQSFRLDNFPSSIVLIIVQYDLLTLIKFRIHSVIIGV